jgi:hypothetical protein
MGAPIISQIHILTAVLIVAAAPQLGTPTLGSDVIPPPAERTFVVAWEGRTYTVDVDDRTYAVDADDRTTVVAWEGRTFVVSAESRIYTVTGD